MSTLRFTFLQVLQHVVFDDLFVIDYLRLYLVYVFSLLLRAFICVSNQIFICDILLRNSLLFVKVFNFANKQSLLDTNLFRFIIILTKVVLIELCSVRKFTDEISVG